MSAQSGCPKGPFDALHGLKSSAVKAPGIDETVYMDGITYKIFRDRYDVLIPRLPSNPTMAAAINMRLLMMDHQTLGMNRILSVT